jgi:hypothetical protein
MLILVLSVFVLILCSGGALMESKIMDRLCDWLFDVIRGGVEYGEDAD